MVYVERMNTELRTFWLQTDHSLANELTEVNEQIAGTSSQGENRTVLHVSSDTPSNMQNSTNPSSDAHIHDYAHIIISCSNLLQVAIVTMIVCPS